jgi:hypothetical protein
MYVMRSRARAGAISGLIVLAMALLLIWPVKARVNSPMAEPPACACCSEEGEWYERSDKTDLVQLDRVKFSNTANTYQGPADENELSINYALSQTRNGRRWQLRFRDDKGKTGAISFTLPARAVYFGADLHESEPGGTGPVLYKEWRLSGTAQVTGVLGKGINGAARFRLILQGRGKGCTEAEDFRNWTLHVSGGRVSYQFYGALAKPD